MSDLSARDRAFITRFPEVFGPLDQLQPLVSYQGLALGDGWMPLLDRLCCDLAAVICDDRLRFRTIQVKQKFGGLRFYAQGGTARAQALIDAAKVRSSKICERCGKLSHLRNRSGYMTTVCDYCWTSWRNGRRADMRRGHVSGCGPSIFRLHDAGAFASMRR